MAHANIFQKVHSKAQKPASAEAHYDDTTLETIKVLGEQVLSLREIIEEQHHVIEDLAGTISHMKVAQKETDQNLNLAYIDQKDLAKQLRILRSSLQANQYVQNREKVQPIQTKEEDHQIEELFFNNAKKSPVMKNAAASDAIKKTLEELKKLEKPKQRFLAKKAAEEEQALRARANQATRIPQQTRTPQVRTPQRRAAEPTQRRSIEPTQRRSIEPTQAQARPQSKAIKQQRFANEDLAKKIIFGKTSKLIR